MIIYTIKELPDIYEDWSIYGIYSDKEKAIKRAKELEAEAIAKHLNDIKEHPRSIGSATTYYVEAWELDKDKGWREIVGEVNL